MFHLCATGVPQLCVAHMWLTYILTQLFTIMLSDRKQNELHSALVQCLSALECDNPTAEVVKAILKENARVVLLQYFLDPLCKPGTYYQLG